ncbi:MAG: hypothetical protein ACD_61C00154G0002 [uncultured bacterium]|nr:MAG: hypothetical protein ACD_61C00154G0002 [uncultured bacterium]
MHYYHFRHSGSRLGRYARNLTVTAIMFIAGSFLLLLPAAIAGWLIGSFVLPIFGITVIWWQAAIAGVILRIAIYIFYGK